VEEHKRRNEPRYVTVEDCARISGEINRKVDLIMKTLVGEDMRGGLVADVRDIKTATSAVKTIIVPIVISVVSAIITAVVLLGLRLA
jgi:hypothetical protein